MASDASASFIYITTTHTTADYVYAGGQGEQNRLAVSQFVSSGTEYYSFSETGPGVTITSWDPPCIGPGGNVVFCPVVSSGSTWDADAQLSDQADSVDMRTNHPARITGGTGADVLQGGSANDSISGNGDEGFDPAPDGGDTIDGRGGADTMYGGAEVDTVTYASRSTGVNVSLDGVANDGGPGEGDTVGSDVENVTGGRGPDVLTGDGADNVLTGLDGGDHLAGLGGNDTLSGGDQNDDLDGGDGGDTVRGDAGADLLRGGPDGDLLDGGTGDDDLTGGTGPDVFVGGADFDSADYTGGAAPLAVTVADNAANDGEANEHDNVGSDVERLFGGEANDRLSLAGISSAGEVFGRGGNDTLTGGNGDDRLEGEGGNDTLEGSYGADLLSGGTGVDTVDYRLHSYVDVGTGEAFGVSSTPDGAANDGNDQIDRGANGDPITDNVGVDVENVLGSAGPDALVGTVDANRLTGNGGDDALNGDAGADTLIGSDGADSLHGDAGLDTLDGGTGPDALDGGSDVDTANYGARTAPLRVTVDDVADDGESGEGDNVSTSVETVQGGTGSDVLTGNAQDNRLLGGDGNDTLNGRLGADTLDGQAGNDTITYADRNAAVAITLDGRRNDGADPNGDGKSGAGEEGDVDLRIENATGGAGNDTIAAAVPGDTVRNLLRGLNGDDTLRSRDGTATVDSLDCGRGTADAFQRDLSDTQVGCEVALP